MTRALRLQGSVFCAIALVLVVASQSGARLDTRLELLTVGVLVLLLGMPHGAFDALVARRLFGTADLKGWALFSLGYVALAAAVVGVWIVAPTFFLCAFLVFSALHFGADPDAAVSRAARVLYGGAVIVLPALWHGPELQQLLGQVAGAASAAWVMPILSQLALPWLAAIALVCALQIRTARLAAFELAVLAALSVTAPPLVAFCVYFCAMHSPRHILRTLASLPANGIPAALSLALWPTLAVVAVAVLVAFRTSSLALETWVMQLIFVGLAALTLPHMLLLALPHRSAPT